MISKRQWNYNKIKLYKGILDKELLFTILKKKINEERLFVKFIVVAG